MGALLVKVGNADGELLPDTDIPPASNVSEQPEVAVQRALTTTTNGATAQVPLNITANSPIANLFFKVAGSADVFRVNFESEGTAAALAQQRAAFETQNYSKALSEGMANLEISIPPNIDAGSFAVEVSAQDVDGRVSLREIGTIQVTRVGTGALQFSLSWDAAVDLDLEVTDPEGARVFFDAPTSASGGRLDQDNTEGGPGSIENIFWEGSAPTGTYAVDVNHFEGAESANFVVTVSSNGTVIDTISRANFQPNEGLLRVYNLTFNGNAGNSSGVAFPESSPNPTTSPIPAPSPSANDPAQVQARLQGDWISVCESFGSSSFRDRVSFEGDLASFSFEDFENGDCSGNPVFVENSVDQIVIGASGITASGQTANAIDFTTVQSNFPEDIGDTCFTIVFVDATQMLFGAEECGLPRTNMLDFDFTFSRVN